jgi:hypothetical protein
MPIETTKTNFNITNTVGNNARVVGQLNNTQNFNVSFSPRLLNYVGPYRVGDVYKTIFYTEVDSNLKVGDRVFIINGNYDSDSLIKINKYKTGKDGYKILYIDKCKVVLDIEYNENLLPYEYLENDNFLKVHYIENQSQFLQCNRSITTVNDEVECKFSYNNNNIIFTNIDYTSSDSWGNNKGLTSSPGFFIRYDVGNTHSWINITDDFMSGSFSLSISTASIDRIKIINGSFTYNGTDFSESYIYKWEKGPTESYSWEVDVRYMIPFLTKSNFRDGNFDGIWNGGVYGQYSKMINWSGSQSQWNNGTIINTNWESGTVNSKYTSDQSYIASLKSDGTPHQKINSPNNSGRGYNYVIDSIIEGSTIKNGSFYNTKIGEIDPCTNSFLENYITNVTISSDNIIEKGFFEKCNIKSSIISNSELNNSRIINSKAETSRSINSYLEDSILLNSIYNSDDVIKILKYDEFIAFEFPFNHIQNSIQKVYKFYIDETSYKRLKIGDTFYIKGLKINDKSKEILNFFDKKFKINSWVEYTEENFDKEINYDRKKGYEYSAFLSTPSDNSYTITSFVGTFSTDTYEENINKSYYSVDVWVSRYDIKDQLTTEKLDYNYSSDLPNYPNYTAYLGDMIDISEAYIIDSDFESGLIQNCEWTNGYHIEDNNDLNLSKNTLSGGVYNIGITESDSLIATVSRINNYPESDTIDLNKIVFIDSLDYTHEDEIKRLGDSYKIINTYDSTNTGYKLQEIGTESISSISGDGVFSSVGAYNRYGYIKKLKIDKCNIYSGFFKRSYINESFIQNREYDPFDKDFDNLKKIRSLLISDSIFSNNLNKLSLATYLNSSFVNGSDTWNCGIVYNSVWNGLTFSNGVIRDSRWVNGVFKNGWFYNSKTFDASPTTSIPTYYSENIKSYYVEGTASPTSSILNNRHSWQDGEFLNGNFYKSDWENGTFSNGSFLYSKFYNGVITGGVIGSNKLPTDYTKIYGASISYTTVENARLYSEDTSVDRCLTQSINWYNGVFKNGIIGSLTPSYTIWHNGVFMDGQFISDAKWKNGKFNNGKFTSGYGYEIGYTESDESLYSWEYGEFNGGEFGNGNALTNSTWYDGIFNDGVFSGRIWNNGIFLKGEFKGSGLTAVGGVSCSNANVFVKSFIQHPYEYYGLWKNGVFSNIIDKYIKTEQTLEISKRNKDIESSKNLSDKSYFKNGLWLNGTFSHKDGIMLSSVWLDGAFEDGLFKQSSFNPFVIRTSDSNTQSFNLDDTTCYWENGKLEDSEFYISHWKDGKFTIGTAYGMIWENGVNEYMNAFNIFWEDGLWRNGNWHGSSFDYNGGLNDEFAKAIINRGISHSGTYSCHLWNIFKEVKDLEDEQVISVTAGTVYGKTGRDLDYNRIGIVEVPTTKDPIFVGPNPNISWTIDFKK